MKKKRYSPEMVNEAKLLYIQKGMTLKQLAEYFGEKGPSIQTFSNWAKRKDKHGKTWHDYREEFQEKKYNELSPRNMAMKIMDKIWEALNSDMDLSKLGDLLAKTQKSLEKLTDPVYQVPVMYQMLQDLILHAKKNYPDIVTEDFLECIRSFKNSIRSRLENGM